MVIDAPPTLKGLRLAAALGLWLVLAAVSGVLTTMLLRLTPRWAGAQVTTPVIVAEVYALLVVSMLVVLGPQFRAGVAWRPFRPSDVSLAVVLTGTAYVVTYAVQSLVAPHSVATTLSILRGIGSDDGRLASSGPFLAGIILIRACLIAPLGEETFFRGALYTWLRKRLAPAPTIAITATAHAAIHGFPAILPLAFVLGLGLGWIRERSRSVVPALIVHVLNNVVLVALSYALTGWTARLPAWG